MNYQRQYGRGDVNYDTWYTSWMKQLARNYSKQELLNRYYGSVVEGKKVARMHLAAIDAAHSMTSQSQRKAQMRNRTAAEGDLKIALDGALEIYDLFPEHTLEHAVSHSEQ
jgi:hypothetical protein